MLPYPLETAIFPVGVSLTRARITRRDMISAMSRCVVGPKSQRLLGILIFPAFKRNKGLLFKASIPPFQKVKTIRSESGPVLADLTTLAIRRIREWDIPLAGLRFESWNNRWEPRHSTPRALDPSGARALREQQNHAASPSLISILQTLYLSLILSISQIFQNGSKSNCCRRWL